MNIISNVDTENFNAVLVAHVDPAQRWDGDEVVAKITEHVDGAPVVERVRVVVARTIHEATTNCDI